MHHDRVRRLLSINGTHYASCSWDYSDNLKLWSKNDFIEICNFEGHTNSVNAIILLNETIMVSGSTDGTIHFWDISKCDSSKNLKSYRNISIGKTIESLSMITDTDYLVGGLDNGNLVLVNINDNENQLPKLLKTSHTGKVSDLEYFDKTKLLASASYDNYIFIINMTNPLNDVLVKKLNNHTSKQFTLSYIQNYLISGDWDGHVCLWNTTDWSHVKTLEGHGDEPITSFLYDNETDALYIGSWDRNIRVWNITTGKLLTTFNTQSVIWSMIEI